MSDTVTEKYVYFVRHGQSAANLEPVFQGPDDPLTALGHEQSRRVADRFRQLTAEVIYTSPMLRAHDTARSIHEATGIPLKEEALFREYVPPSALWGQPKEVPEGQRFLFEQRAHIADPDWHYADEDTYHDLHLRSVAALTFLIEQPAARMVVVTHAGLLRVLMTAMLTEGAADPLMATRFMRFLKPHNTGVTLVRYRSAATRRNRWRLLTWNDYSHLGDLLPPAQHTWEDEP